MLQPTHPKVWTDGGRRAIYFNEWYRSNTNTGAWSRSWSISFGTKVAWLQLSVLLKFIPANIWGLEMVWSACEVDNQLLWYAHLLAWRRVPKLGIIEVFLHQSLQQANRPHQGESMLYSRKGSTPAKSKKCNNKMLWALDKAFCFSPISHEYLGFQLLALKLDKAFCSSQLSRSSLLDTAQL